MYQLVIGKCSCTWRGATCEHGAEPRIQWRRRSICSLFSRCHKRFWRSTVAQGVRARGRRIKQRCMGSWKGCRASSMQLSVGVALERQTQRERNLASLRLMFYFQAPMIVITLILPLPPPAKSRRFAQALHRTLEHKRERAKTGQRHQRTASSTIAPTSR